jgi:cyclopropane-fatty-acyl-phospholipid synthase
MIDIMTQRQPAPILPASFQSSNELRHWVQSLLSKADIQVQDRRPWDIKVHQEELWPRIATQGSLGLGEAYMEGLWDCNALDQFFDRVLSARLPEQVNVLEIPIVELLRSFVFNNQSKSRSQKVVDIHYNLGNPFYEAMLDSNMQYTCGYYSSGALTLEEAQEAKLHLICKKLNLKPGERVLELGSGWGGFARFAARHYGVEVVAYNISKEQVEWAQARNQGWPIEYRLQDYREATGTFDKIVSIGMCEHVGPANHRAFFQLVHDRLKEGGVCLLHTIGKDKSINKLDPWFAKYIFPGAILPSTADLGKAMDGLFVLEDWHNFGCDYDQTLMAWHRRFEAAWPRFRGQYSDRFYRMWRYYLLSSAGAFRSRYIQLFQIVLSKGGIRGGWRSVR